MVKGLLSYIGRNGIIIIWEKLFIQYASKSLNIFLLLYLGYSACGTLS